MLGNEVLPQPYRFINKLVQKCVDLALEDIVKNLTRGAVVDKKYLPSTMTPVFDLATDAFSPDNDDRLGTITNVTTIHPNNALSAPPQHVLLQNMSSSTSAGLGGGSSSPNAKPPAASAGMDSSTSTTAAGNNNAFNSNNTASVLAALTANMRGRSPMAELLAAHQSAQQAKEKKEALQLPLPQAKRIASTCVGRQFTIVGTQAGTCALFSTNENEHLMTTPILIAPSAETSSTGVVNPFLSSSAVGGSNATYSSEGVSVAGGTSPAAGGGGGGNARSGGKSSAAPKASGGGSTASSPNAASGQGGGGSAAAAGSPLAASGSLNANRSAAATAAADSRTFPEGIIAVHGGTPLHPQGLSLFAAASTTDGVIVFAADADQLSVQPIVPPPRPIPVVEDVPAKRTVSPSSPLASSSTPAGKGVTGKGGRRSSLPAKEKDTAAATAATVNRSASPTPSQQQQHQQQSLLAQQQQQQTQQALLQQHYQQQQRSMGLNSEPKEPATLHVVAKISGRLIAALAFEHLKSLQQSNAFNNNQSANGTASASPLSQQGGGSGAMAGRPRSNSLTGASSSSAAGGSNSGGGGSNSNSNGGGKGANKSDSGNTAAGSNSANDPSSGNANGSAAVGGEGTDQSASLVNPASMDPNRYGAAAALQKLVAQNVLVSPTAAVPSSVKLSPDGAFLAIGLDDDATLLIFDLTEEPLDIYLADRVVRVPKFLTAVSAPTGLSGPVVDGSMLRAKAMYEFLCDSKRCHIRAGITVEATNAVIALGGGRGAMMGGGGEGIINDGASSKSGALTARSNGVGGARSDVSSVSGYLPQYSSRTTTAAGGGGGGARPGTNMSSRGGGGGGGGLGGIGLNAQQNQPLINTRAPLPTYTHSLVVAWAGSNAFSRVTVKDDGIGRTTAINAASSALITTISNASLAQLGTTTATTTAGRSNNVIVGSNNSHSNNGRGRPFTPATGGGGGNSGGVYAFQPSSAFATVEDFGNNLEDPTAPSTVAAKAYAASNLRTNAAQWQQKLSEMHAPLLRAYAIAAQTAGSVAANASAMLFNPSGKKDGGGGGKGGGGGGGGAGGSGKESAAAKEAAAQAAAAQAQFLGATTHPAMGQTQFGPNGYSSHIAQHIAGLAGIGLTTAHASNLYLGGIGTTNSMGGGGSGQQFGSAADLAGSQSSATSPQDASISIATVGGGGAMAAQLLLGQHQQHIFAPLQPSAIHDQLIPQIVTATAVDPSHRLFAVCCQNALTMVFDGDTLKFRFYFNDAPHRMQQRSMRQMSCVQAVFQNRDTLTVCTVTHGKSYRSFVSVFALNPDVAARMNPDKIASMRRSDVGVVGGDSQNTLVGGSTFKPNTTTNNTAGPSPTSANGGRGITGLSNTVISRLDMTSNTKTDAALLARMPGPLEEMLAAFDDKRKQNALTDNTKQVRGVYGAHSLIPKEKKDRLMEMREAMVSSCSVGAQTNATTILTTTSNGTIMPMPSSYLRSGSSLGESHLPHHSAISYAARAGASLSKEDANITETYQGELICKVPYLDQLIFAAPIGDFPILLVRASGGRQFVIDMTCGELLGILKDAGSHCYRGPNTPSAVYTAAANKFYGANSITNSSHNNSQNGSGSGPAATTTTTPYATLTTLLANTAAANVLLSPGGSSATSASFHSTNSGALRTASAGRGGGGSSGAAVVGAAVLSQSTTPTVSSLKPSGSFGGGGGKDGGAARRSDSISQPGTARGHSSASVRSGSIVARSGTSSSSTARNAAPAAAAMAAAHKNPLDGVHPATIATVSTPLAISGLFARPAPELIAAHNAAAAHQLLLAAPAAVAAQQTSHGSVVKYMAGGPFTFKNPKPSTVAFTVKLSAAVPSVVLTDDSLVLSCDGGRSVQRYPMLPLLWRFYPKLKEHFSLEPMVAFNADGEEELVPVGNPTLKIEERSQSQSAILAPQLTQQQQLKPLIGVGGGGAVGMRVSTAAYHTPLNSGHRIGGGGLSSTTTARPTSGGGGATARGKAHSNNHQGNNSRVQQIQTARFGLSAASPEALALAFYYWPHSARIDLIDSFVVSDVDAHVARRLGVALTMNATLANSLAAGLQLHQSGHHHHSNNNNNTISTHTQQRAIMSGSLNMLSSPSSSPNNSPGRQQQQQQQQYPRALTPGGILKSPATPANESSRMKASTPQPTATALHSTTFALSAAASPSTSPIAASAAAQPLPLMSSKFADIVEQSIDARLKSRRERDQRLANTWRTIQGITASAAATSGSQNAALGSSSQRR